MKQSRPGGRTARTTAAVFAAVEALLAEKPPGAISIAEVAERAGVAATSLYRRWGDLPTLLMEVAVDRLTEELPLPDTGSLEGDLTAWATAIAASLASREGSQFFRVYVATAPLGRQPTEGRTAAVMRRIDQIDAMLGRARSRGERPPAVLEVTDHLLAPLYMRALFGVPADASVARGLVTRLLTHTPR